MSINYKKTEWKRGTVFNPSNMNNLESGIKAACDGVNALADADTLLSARMDTFSLLPSGSTAGDAELADARIGTDGTTYSNVGGAIRKQIAPLETAIANASNINLITLPYYHGSSFTDKGVTFTADAIGNVTINGTATGGSAGYNFKSRVNVPKDERIDLTDGWYMLSGMPGIAGVSIRINYTTQESTAVVLAATTSETIFYYSKSAVNPKYGFAAYIVVNQNVTVNNLTVRPKLVRLSDYEKSLADNYVAPLNINPEFTYSQLRYTMLKDSSGNVYRAQAITYDTKRNNYIITGGRVDEDDAGTTLGCVFISNDIRNWSSATKINVHCSHCGDCTYDAKNDRLVIIQSSSQNASYSVVDLATNTETSYGTPSGLSGVMGCGYNSADGYIYGLGAFTNDPNNMGYTIVRTKDAYTTVEFVKDMAESDISSKVGLSSAETSTQSAFFYNGRLYILLNYNTQSQTSTTRDGHSGFLLGVYDTQGKLVSAEVCHMDFTREVECICTVGNRAYILLDGDVIGIFESAIGCPNNADTSAVYLKNGTDLNDVLFAGKYSCTSAGNAKLISNKPQTGDRNFSLKVERLGKNGVKQIYYDGGNPPYGDVCIRTVYPDTSDVVAGKWKTIRTFDTDRKILAIGDSICYGYRNKGLGYVGYLGMPYKNEGVSGASITTNDASGRYIINQLENTNYEPDIIIAEGGINDYRQSFPLGTPSKSIVVNDTMASALDKTTIYGALEYLFYLMIKKFRNAQRFFVSIHKVCRDGTTYYPTTKNSAGYTQEDLHNAICETAIKYGVTVIDIYDSFSTMFSQYRSTVAYDSSNPSTTANEYVDMDGLHPLALGYQEFYVPAIKSAIMSDSRNQVIIPSEVHDRLDDLESEVDSNSYGSVGGRNLIPHYYYERSKTTNGVAFTVNKDNSITVNGTASAAATFIISHRIDNCLVLKSGTYTISGCPSGGSSSSYQLQVGRTKNNAFDFIGRDIGSGLTFTLSETTDIYVAIYIPNGVTISNLVFKPMLEAGNEIHDYEPYFDSNRTLTTDTSDKDGIAFLGWSCPDAMPIKNYRDSSGVFHQRVGRVDLGTLNWLAYQSTSDTTKRYMACTELQSVIKKTTSNSAKANIYCSKYTTLIQGDVNNCVKGVACTTSGNLCIYDSDYNTSSSVTAFRTAMSGQYLYYELNSEITFADGKEVIAKSGIDGLQFSVSGNTLTITNGTKTWTLT